MSKVLYVQAWDYIRSELEDLIIEEGYSEVTFIWQLEWELDLTQRAIDYINTHKVKINLITCIGEISWLINHTASKGIDRSLIHCEVWPEFWFLRSHHSLKNLNKFYSTLDNNKFDFKYPFISLNGRWRDYRTSFIDALAKYSYLDKGLVSYHQEGKAPGAPPALYYNDQNLYIDDTFSEDSDSYNFNQLYLDSFLHIPTESTLQAFMLSEKTATPILCKKLFLTFGAPRYHEKLHRILGIEPYTELFDYSFDHEVDTNKRIEKLMKNIQFVLDNQHRYQEMYDSVKQKVENNYKRAMHYVHRYELLPPMIKKYYSIISNPSIRITGFDKELLDIAKNFKDKQIPNHNNLQSFHPDMYYDLWDRFDFDLIVNDLKVIKPTRTIILGENEWDPWFTPEFVEEINKSDAKFLYITGAKDLTHAHSKFAKAGIKDYKLQSWPTFWLNYSEKLLKEPDHRTYTPNLDFKYPFISLNNRGHVHRLLYMDELAKRNLIDKGVVTWHDIHNENQHIPLKHFDRVKRIKLDDDFDTKLDSFIVPKQFHESFFDFVSECCNETIMISEKTAIPLLLKKPFAVLGAPHYHAYLKELGFELYDELIDYSFDSVVDLEERVRLFVNNIERVSKLTDLKNAYEMLREKIEFNYYHYHDVIKDFNLIPKEIQKIIATTPENENMPVTAYQSKYRELMKRAKVPFLIK